MAKKKGGLGRGLDALFADAAPIYEEDAQEDPAIEIEEGPVIAEKPKASKKKTSGDPDLAATDEDRIVYIDINDIKPGASQPRKKFDEDKLRELANSIRENGVIQPLVVRKNGSGYELVAGERRWRASRLAELKKVPCIVRSFDEKQTMIVAIIENMQREDLDPIEEANGIQQMVRKYGFTQEQASATLGKSRAYIANSLRLLKLPEEIKTLITEGAISAAHGRTIINVGDAKTQKQICDKIVKGGLSVRATERLAEKAKDDSRPARKIRTSPSKDREIATAEGDLRKIMGTKVNINGTKSTGKIEIEYYSLEELNRLIEMLQGLD